MDGLAKIARDFGEVRAQDEHDAILATLQGVAAKESSYGAGYADFGGDYDDTDTGFFVDVGAAGAFDDICRAPELCRYPAAYFVTPLTLAELQLLATVLFSAIVSSQPFHLATLTMSQIMSTW